MGRKTKDDIVNQTLMLMDEIQNSLNECDEENCAACALGEQTLARIKDLLNLLGYQVELLS